MASETITRQEFEERLARKVDLEVWDKHIYGDLTQTLGWIRDTLAHIIEVVATKEDLARLEMAMKEDLARLERKIDERAPG